MLQVSKNSHKNVKSKKFYKKDFGLQGESNLHPFVSQANMRDSKRLKIF